MFLSYCNSCFPVPLLYIPSQFFSFQFFSFQFFIFSFSLAFTLQFLRSSSVLIALCYFLETAPTHVYNDSPIGALTPLATDHSAREPHFPYRGVNIANLYSFRMFITVLYPGHNNTKKSPDRLGNWVDALITAIGREREESGDNQKEGNKKGNRNRIWKENFERAGESDH